MTAHAIAGLFALNLLILAAGVPVLWAVVGLRHRRDVVRLAGVAYMLGLVVVGSVLVLELVVGIPFGLATVLLTVLVVAAAAVVAGRLAGRVVPTEPGGAGRRFASYRLVSALGATIAILYLEAVFRLGRLAGLYEWDSMAFWVPKGKAIYYFHGLDHQFFTTLPGPSYPPIVPALEAAAFEFMGSPDAVTLHLMFWFPLAGFIAAVVGLLATRVHPLVLWPGALVVVFTPSIADGPIAPAGDALLDYFVALSALMVALWVLDRRPSQLVTASIFLAGAMLTKREGFLLALCMLAAGAVAVGLDRRDSLSLAAAGAGAFVVSLPWRIWFESRGIGGEGPETGLFGFLGHLDRGWPSVRLTLDVLFDWSMWYLVMPLALVAVAAAVLARSYRLALFAAVFIVLAVLAFSWTTWSFPSIPITKNGALNPIGRLSGSLVVALAGLLPLLLDAGWRGKRAAGADALT